VARKK